MDPGLEAVLCREQRTVIPTAKETRLQCELVKDFLMGHEGCQKCRSNAGDSSSSIRRCRLLWRSFRLWGESVFSDYCDATRRKRSRTCHTIRKYSLKLREVFAWLILLAIMQSACAAPPRNSPNKKDMNGDLNGSRPPWINPCGTGPIDETSPPDMTPMVSDQMLFNQIIIQAKLALSDAKAYRDDYVKRTFKVNFEEQNAWNIETYEWLPKIPKSLDEKVSVQHLESLTDLASTFSTIYNYLQRFSAGLEQITRDQDETDGHFKSLFRTTEFKLRAVLCEIQYAIIEKGFKGPEDVTRDIISDDIRNIEDNTHRNLRDWVIFRDYMNALEYVIQVFEHLKSKAEIK